MSELMMVVNGLFVVSLVGLCAWLLGTDLFGNWKYPLRGSYRAKWGSD